MSMTLHRNGLATVLASVTGTGASKLKAVYKWPRRNMADAALAYPFATIDKSEGKPEDYSTVGQGGINGEYILTRIRIFDTYAADETQYAAFTALVDAALTALRKDSNLRLGQQDQGCTLNKIVGYSIEPQVSNTPPVLVGIIDCLGTYRTTRT
jgi:hypothetical protein